MTRTAPFSRTFATLCVAFAFLWPAAPAAGADEPIQPLPLEAPPSLALKAKIELGRRLFEEPRLSANNRIACVSCHSPAHAGADGLKRSAGLHGRLGERNTPSIYNAAYNFRQGWSGERKSIEAQIDHVLQSPSEMGSSWPAITAKLSAESSWRAAFQSVYGREVTSTDVRDALAAYTRSLTTPNSRFDRWLRGDADAITPVEAAGYRHFKKFGCAACHQGVNVGGNMVQRLGVLDGATAAPGAPLYKVPSLRNVARTAPYFHDGSAATLEEAVDVMLRVQVGRLATAPERRALVEFLRTLDAEPAR